MNGARLHCIWFLHQPAFIPDAEIVWRIDSTYLPLFDALAERSIACSLGITGSLLQRCAALRPDFVDTLAEAAGNGRLTLLGTAAHHPVLPWLSSRSAEAQVGVDRTIKRQLDLPVANVFWPTELAWSARIGALARAHRYSAVVIDSASRDAADMLPRWSDEGNGLRPQVRIVAPLGAASKIETPIGAGADESMLTLWVRERSLSKALLEAIHGVDEDERSHLRVVAEAIGAARARARDPGAPLLLAEDAERLLPDGLARLLGLLDGAQAAGLEFVGFDAFDRADSGGVVGYVPAGTMEETDAMWLATLDDAWYREHLARVGDRVEARFDLLQPRDEQERAIRDALLRAQDSSFYFWHYVARTRQSFYADLLTIERWLDPPPRR